VDVVEKRKISAAFGNCILIFQWSSR